MNKMEFSGKSVEDALSEAAKVLGVERSAVSYNVLQPAKGGLLSKLFSRSVRIEAWTEKADDLSLAAQEAVREIMGRKASRTEISEQEKRPSEEQRGARRGRSGKAQAAAEPPTDSGSRSRQGEKRGREAGERKPREARPAREERKKSPAPQRDESADAAPRNLLPLTSPEASAVFEEFKAAFLRSFEIETANCDESRDEGGNVTLTIQDEYLEGILAKSDRLSLAFEHLFKRVAQKRVGDVGGRIYLSAGKADEIRQQALRDFAHSLAEKVRRTGKAITVASKTSQERRVIHLTLDGMSGVATRSVGSGDKRRLIVYSTEAKGGGRKGAAPAGNDGADGSAEGGTSRRSSGKKRRGRGRRPEAGSEAVSRATADEAPSGEAL